LAAAPGNQYAAKAKLWKAAIERALDARASRLEGRLALDALAERLLEKCDEGDMAALKELGDRLDGKAHQTVDANVSGSLTTVLAGLGRPGSSGNNP
jgi:hypothetical protein